MIVLCSEHHPLYPEQDAGTDSCLLFTFYGANRRGEARLMLQVQSSRFIAFSVPGPPSRTFQLVTSLPYEESEASLTSQP